MTYKKRFSRLFCRDISDTEFGFSACRKEPSGSENYDLYIIFETIE